MTNADDYCPSCIQIHIYTSQELHVAVCSTDNPRRESVRLVFTCRQHHHNCRRFGPETFFSTTRHLSSCTAYGYSPTRYGVYSVKLCDNAIFQRWRCDCCSTRSGDVSDVLPNPAVLSRVSAQFPLVTIILWVGEVLCENATSDFGRLLGMLWYRVLLLKLPTVSSYHFSLSAACIQPHPRFPLRQRPAPSPRDHALLHPLCRQPRAAAHGGGDRKPV